MNIKIYERNKNNEYSDSHNNTNHKNNSRKIKEKYIMFNNEKTIRNENKIKELDIVIKNSKMENNISQKRDNNSKINNVLKSSLRASNNSPYLKPKFPTKDKNFLSIKNRIDNNNEEINNIYLNLFKVYYDENGKKIKIINSKSNYKKNNSKEIVLTQKNSNLKLNLIDKKNNKNNTNKIKKNYSTKYFGINPAKKAIENINEIMYFYQDTPSKSTKNINKDCEKNVTDIIKKEKNNVIFSSLNSLNKENNKEKNRVIIQGSYCDNLSSLLKKRKNQKKNDKKYKKKNIDKKVILNNTEKISVLKQSIKKLRKELSQGFLTKNNNNDKFNFNNNEKEINLSNIQKDKNKYKINRYHRIDYFYNDISNLTLNMTFNQNNITNNISTNCLNSNLKNIYISPVKKKNLRKQLIQFNPLCLNNELITEGKKLKNNRHSVGLQGSCTFYNFFREKDKENNNMEMDRNNTYFYQKLKKYYTNLNSKNNSYENSNLSINGNNVNKYNISNNLNLNYFTNENENNIVNKPKQILKVNELDMNNNIQNKYKNLESNKFQTTAHKSQSYLGYSTKSFFKIKKNNYSSGKLNSITSNNNEKLVNNNIGYYSNSKLTTENNKQDNNFSHFIKRPYSLCDVSKQLFKTENIKNNNYTLLNYYNTSIPYDTHSNMIDNNIFENTNNKYYLYGKVNEDYFSNYKDGNMDEINNNCKDNTMNNIFININHIDDAQKLINKRIIQKLKYNRNKNFAEHSNNNSLNFTPSNLLIKKHII